MLPCQVTIPPNDCGQLAFGCHRADLFTDGIRSGTVFERCTDSQARPYPRNCNPAKRMTRARALVQQGRNRCKCVHEGRIGALLADVVHHALQ